MKKESGEFIVAPAVNHGFRVIRIDSRAGHLSEAYRALEQVDRSRASHAKGRDVHVVFSKDSGAWAVRVVGRDESFAFRTKTEATTCANTLGKERRSKVVLHDKAGRIKESRSFA